MLLAYFAAVVGIVILALAFVVGLAYIRQRRGPRQQNFYMATTQFIGALLFDLMVFYFSVSFCTSALKESLRLRGRDAPNPLMEDFWRRLGSSGLDLASQWGFITPIMSWITAHALVIALVLTIRHLSGILQSAAADGEAAPAPNYSGLLGSVAGLVGSFVVFWYTVRQDVFLVRYQIISSSRPLRQMLGDDWEGRLTPDEVIEILRQSFVGQLALHSGAFYVITLLVAAWLIVTTVPNLIRAIDRLPRGNQYVVQPLQLPGAQPPPLAVPPGAAGPPVLPGVPAEPADGPVPPPVPPPDVPLQQPPEPAPEHTDGFYIPPEE